MKKLYFTLVENLKKLESLPLLFIRLILAYGFYQPAMTKLSNVNAIGEWFESMEMPLPYLNAYLITTVETLGVILLLLGLGIRFISVALIIAMMVAIKVAHWENGFPASENGFEIPLYYIIMLFTLFVFGGGKLSVDYLIGKKTKR